MPKKTVTGTIKLRATRIVSDAIENGVERGWNRAHKHTDTPSPEHLKETIGMAVMESLDEVFDYGDNE